MPSSPILSVIIPVYSTEEYLSECLASVTKQTLEGIEVIIVNDGSPDDSHRIINAYEFVFQNFVSISISNQGQSVARNIGLKRATGKYVTFLDSDDWVPPQAYELLVEAAERTDSEICIGVAKTFNGQRSWVNPQMKELYDCVCSHAKFDAMVPLVRDASPCNKIFLRDLLTREKLEFPVGVSIREDLHLVLQAYVAAKAISVLPSVVYYYRVRGKESPPSRTQETGVKIFEDLIWVRHDLQRRLLGEISARISETLDASFLGYIQYRLYLFLAGQERDTQQNVLLAIQSFLKEIPHHLVGQAVSPETRAMMLLVRSGEFESARKLAIDKREKRLMQTQSDLGSLVIEGLSDALRELADTESESRGWKGLRKKAIRIHGLAVAKGRQAVAENSIPVPRAQAIPRVVKLTSARVKRLLGPKKETWLVGERRGMSAEDTGIAFFRYLRKEHPEIDSYFVTKSDFGTSPEARELGNVLHYGSAKSYEILLNASVLAYSDNGQDFFRKWGRVAKLLPNDTVGCFLQHGVIGFSAMGGLYSKKEMTKRKEKIDLFVTSSPIEKEIVKKYLGFEDSEVVVTGLSRFDALSQASTNYREILYMPSWREWLGPKQQEDYLRSEYFASVQGLLSDHRLHRMLDEHDHNLVFAGHFAMQERYQEFRVQSPRIKFLDPKLCPLQESIKRAGLLITDYSSVAFDFAYQKKPVVFYQFDAERFYQTRGMMMIDPTTELFGRSVRTQAEVLFQISKYLQSDRHMEPEFQDRCDTFFPVTDSNNCERIFQEIIACQERKRAR